MSRGKILIVEDEFLVAAELEAAIEERGFTSAGIAPDLEAALALAAQRPDLALVDVHLRDGQTGPLIAERLARDFNVRVLFVTANPRMVIDASTPGLIGVLNKPCAEELIAEAVEYALRDSSTAPLPAPPAGLTLLRAGALSGLSA